MFSRFPHFASTILVPLALVLIVLFPTSAPAQVFVAQDNGTIAAFTPAGTVINPSVAGSAWSIAASNTELFVMSSGGTFWKYSPAGVQVNTFQISGLGTIGGIAASGNDLYVTSYSNGTVGKYNTVTGAAINATLLSGLGNPGGVFVSGSDMYVGNYGTGAIGKYNSITGATVTASFVSGLSLPGTMAVSGGNLFVFERTSGGRVGEYDAVTGATINAALVASVQAGPGGVAVSGSDLYTTNFNAGTLNKYTLGATPGTISASFPALVSGLNGPDNIAIIIPEPASLTLMVGGAIGLLLRRRRPT